MDIILRRSLPKLREKLLEALQAVLPIVAIVLVLCFTVAPVSPSILLCFLLGAAMIVVGIMFFTLGAEMSMTPMGEGTVLCALDARRAQVYSAAFDLATHTRLLDDDARAVTDLADFVENCKKPLFFVGDGAGLCYNKYSNVPGVLQTPPALRGGRAAAVALVAKQMAAAGQAVLPEALLPDYHRLSQAERERAERLAAEAAANKQ